MPPNVPIENPNLVFTDTPVSGIFPSVIPAADTLEYATPSLVKAWNGFVLVGAHPPFDVILPGDTAASVADLIYWQHRSFVFVIFVRGEVGGGKFDV